jgi:hypothetical protein
LLEPKELLESRLNLKILNGDLDYKQLDAQISIEQHFLNRFFINQDSGI